MQKLIILLSIISLSSFGQRRVVDHEWFSYSLYGTYSVEDEFFGTTGKLSFPMQKGFNFVAQGTLFPNQINGALDEYRYLFNVELIPYHGEFFGFYFQTGLDEGFWKRSVEIENYTPAFTGFIRDNSIMFGGGIEFIKDRFSLVIDYKYYPEINRNHVSAGLRVLFFEDKRIRKSYYDYLLKRKIKRSRSNRKSSL